MGNDPKVGCCGDVESLTNTVTAAVGHLVLGHRGVAKLYRELAKQTVGPALEAFVREAEKHEQMAKDCMNIPVPASVATPGEVVDGKGEAGGG